MKPIVFISVLLCLQSISAKAQQLKPCVTTSGPYWHIVQSGETLMSISRKYAIDTSLLIWWNQIKDASKIQRCQRIKLIEPDIYRQRVKKKDVQMPGPAILSLSTSNLYKRQMDSMNQFVQKIYTKNPSGELEYYLDYPWIINPRWTYPETHFRNPEKDLIRFLLLMHELGLILQKKKLSDNDKISLRKTLIEVKNSKIKPVYANGFLVRERIKNTKIPKMSPLIKLANWQIVDSTSSPIPNTTYYLIQVSAFLQCLCDNCFAEKKDGCDIDHLEPFILKKDGANYRVSAGPYHLFVTKKTGSIEKVIHYEKKKVTGEDYNRINRIVVKGK